jgi:hypothetical protein
MKQLTLLVAVLAVVISAKAQKHQILQEKDMGAYLMVYHKDCDHSLHIAISYDWLSLWL